MNGDPFDALSFMHEEEPAPHPKELRMAALDAAARLNAGTNANAITVLEEASVFLSWLDE